MQKKKGFFSYFFKIELKIQFFFQKIWRIYGNKSLFWKTFASKKNFEFLFKVSFKTEEYFVCIFPLFEIKNFFKKQFFSFFLLNKGPVLIFLESKKWGKNCSFFLLKRFLNFRSILFANTFNLHVLQKDLSVFLKEVQNSHKPNIL